MNNKINKKIIIIIIFIIILIINSFNSLKIKINCLLNI